MATLAIYDRFLNRGNHEDAGICCVFGFMKECLGTYDEVTFRSAMHTKTMEDCRRLLMNFWARSCPGAMSGMANDLQRSLC